MCLNKRLEQLAGSAFRGSATILVLVIALCSPAEDASGNRLKALRKKALRKYPMTLRPYTAKKYPDHGLKDRMTDKGTRARGFYVTPYYLFRVGAERTAKLLKRAHINAVVIDVKDDWGQILWPSKVPLTKGIQRHLVPKPREVVKTFHKYGLYVMARVVAFKDSKLPFKRPDLSVRFRPGKKLFWAMAGWLDAYSPEVRDYLIDICLEWQSYGADEIQLDYIRFPKGNVSTYGMWLHQAKDSRDRDKLIADFLNKLDRALKIPLSVDIFGLTTLVDGDPRKLGQTIEKMAPYVEAISPMMYPQGMRSYYKNSIVTKAVYSLLECGLWRGRQKAPNIVLRPYLQSYRRAIPFYGAEFIKQQVRSAEKTGSDGFIFWNSSMHNEVAYRALQQMGKKKLEAFGTNTAKWKRYKAPRWCYPPGEGNVFGKRKRKKKR
jgi:hypothetical protein